MSDGSNLEYAFLGYHLHLLPLVEKKFFTRKLTIFPCTGSMRILAAYSVLWAYTIGPTRYLPIHELAL